MVLHRSRLGQRRATRARTAPFVPLALLCAGCNSSAPPPAPEMRAPETAATSAAPSASSPEPTVTAAASGQSAPTPPRLDDVPFAAQSNPFALDLYARLRAKPGNLAFSPASLTTALAMTWSGARGETAAEMARTLHFAGSQAAVIDRASRFLAAANDPKRTTYTLRMVNRLFGEKTYTFEPAFVKQTADAFAAPLEGLDFKGAHDPARRHINGWVAKQTNDRIKDLVPASGVSSATLLVLVNAVYFLADWQTPFSKEATRPAPFHTSATEAHPVPTMTQTASFRYAAVDGLKLLEMPYAGGELAMLFLLPDRRDGISDLEQRLTPDALVAWVTRMSPQRVAVALPKFEIDPPDSTPLGELLVAMGMKLAFAPTRADFSGISRPPGLYIGEVFHKAFVKVDEKGTEAAAGSAVVMGPGGAPPAPAPEFRADHPFLFVLRDLKTGMILFLGRVASPATR